MLTTAVGLRVEQWRLAAGETTDLPAGAVQVLDGEVETGGAILAAGALLALETVAPVKAVGPATLLVTRRL